MVNDVCKKHYPWAFSEKITQGEDGYFIYCQWNDGRRFERFQMALRMTTDGWYPTTPTLPRCLMHILTSRCPSIFRVSNTFLNTFIKVLTMLQQWSLVQQTRFSNTLTFNIWALLKGLILLLLFKKHTKWPPVTRLIVHLPGQHNVIFNENEDLAVVAERVARQITTLIAYFAYNAQNADGWNVVYADFPVDHVWKIRKKVWSAWQWREKGVGRMFFVHPAISERFFLYLLITIVLIFKDLRIVDDIEHPTFQVACEALGLVQDPNSKWDTCI